MLIELLIGGRRLFLATVYGPGTTQSDARHHNQERGRSFRSPLIRVCKDLVQSCIQLGAAGKLGDTDIREFKLRGRRSRAVFVYRLLVAGRILLSCNFCAKADNDRNGAADCRRAIQAALMLLNRLAEERPFSLGAAETLEETCRSEWPRPGGILQRLRQSVR